MFTEGHDRASEGEQGKTDECAEGKKGKKCGDESSQERGGMASGGDHSAAIDYIVGWDPEHNNAWKMDHNGKYRDFATEIKTDGAAEDPVVAVFACGYTCGIPNYTVGDFLASKADGDQPGSSKVDGDEPGSSKVDGDQRGSSKELKSPYFHGRLSTGGLVSLKDRRNGGVRFVVVTCPEGQVAQCRGDLFGSLDQTVAALTPLADDYARGVLTRASSRRSSGGSRRSRSRRPARRRRNRRRKSSRRRSSRRRSSRRRSSRRRSSRRRSTRRRSTRREPRGLATRYSTTRTRCHGAWTRTSRCFLRAPELQRTMIVSDHPICGSGGGDSDDQRNSSMVITMTVRALPSQK